MSAPCKVLLTGASGLLGRAIYEVFTSDQKWEITGLAYSRCGDAYRKCDLTDRTQVEEVFNEIKPRLLIHAAAERRPDVVEKNADATESLNVTATQTLCQIAASSGCTVLYMSTDYVFDGKNAPYGVGDAPNPINKYGISKLAGEKTVLQESADNIILRVPVLYGPVETLDESAVTTIYQQVASQSPATVCNYNRRYPTHVTDVANVINQLLKKRLQDKSRIGIFHWSGNEMYTKYNMAVDMANNFELSHDHLMGDTSAPSGATNRPYDANLDRSRLENLGIVADTVFKEGIRKSITPFVVKSS